MKKKPAPPLVKQKSNRDIFASNSNGQATRANFKRTQSQPVLQRSVPNQSNQMSNGKENIRTNSSPSKAGIFYGINIFLVPRGIGKVQYDILKKNIESKGGTVQSVLSQTSHCIVTKLTYEDLLSHLKLDSAPSCSLHSLEWLTESLRRGKCLPKEDFRLSSALYSSLSLPTLQTGTARMARIDRSPSKEKASPIGDKSPLSFKWRPDTNDEDSSDTEEDNTLVESFMEEQKKANTKKPTPLPPVVQVSQSTPRKTKHSFKRKRASLNNIATSKPTTTTKRVHTSSTQPVTSSFDIFSTQNDWLSFEEDEDIMDTEGGTDQKPAEIQAEVEAQEMAAHGSDTINDNEENEEEEEEEENISFHLENSSLDLSSSLSRSPPSSITTEDLRTAAKKEDATSSCSLSLPSTVSPFASPLVHIPTIHSPLAVSPNPSPPHVQQNEASNAALFLSSTQPDDPALMEADMFFSELQDSEAEELDLSNPQSKKKPTMDWLGKGDPRKDPYFAPLFIHSKNKSPTTKSSPSKDNASVGILEKITSSSSLSTTLPTTPPDSPPREIYTQLKEEIGHSPFVTESSSSYDTDKEKQQQLKGRKQKRDEEKQEKEALPKPSSNVLLVPNTPRVKSWSKRLVCQQPSTDPPARVNHNKAITDIFEVMLQKSESTGDKWRAFAYRKAITALKAHPKQITNVEQARNIRGVGAKILEKIGEILATGALRKAEATDEMSDTMAIFSKIWGAGVETCKKWYAKGYRKLEDLKEADLTKSQAVGLKYYYEFQHRIPRDEVRELERRVKEAARTISPQLKAIACGSYRRGKSDCGDIDCLVTHKKGHNLDGVLAQILDYLKDSGFITEDLTSGKKGDVYMGVCQLNAESLHRRIDIRLIPRENWAFALLYFTGSDHFNRSMRLWARKHGMSLNEKGLHRRFTNDVKGEPFPGIKTEEQVFKALGLDYVPPHKRDV